MSDKYSRSGGKFSGNHTTLTPAACLMADIAHACEAVYRISPGFLKAGLKTLGGPRRVKIIDFGTMIQLSVRDNSSNQEIQIYTNDLQATKLAIARGARNHQLAISFENRTKLPTGPPE